MDANLDLMLSGLSISGTAPPVASAAVAGGVPGVEEEEETLAFDDGEINFPEEYTNFVAMLQMQTDLTQGLNGLQEIFQGMESKPREQWTPQDVESESRLNEQAMLMVEKSQEIGQYLNAAPRELLEMHQCAVETEQLMEALLDVERRHCELFEGISNAQQITPDMQVMEHNLLDELEAVEASADDAWTKLQSYIDAFNQLYQTS